MKKIIVLLILAAIGLYYAHNSGYDVIPDGVNRNQGLIYRDYPARMDEVKIHIRYGHAYHTQYGTCHEIEAEMLGINPKNYVVMTEYEAIQRGFFKCPDCLDSSRAIETTVEDAIVDTLTDLFG